MKKLAIVTSTRAEYGLLYPLINKIMEEPDLKMDLFVSGTHLLEKYGHTIEYIIKDGVPIKKEIPIFEDDFMSNEADVASAIAKATSQMGSVLAEEKYDAMVVLGDRYELLGFCSAAVVCRVPIVHIHGGEITEGAIDDKIRHAITKLASLHFPSIKEYANRIIQMGENPNRVHAVGALGLDNVLKLPLIDKDDLLEQIEVETNLPIAAVTFHPVTGENPQCAIEETKFVMEALLKSGVFSVITMPNSDVGGDAVYGKIIEYVQKNPQRMVLRKSLGQVRYLSLLKCADVMVGNSSSGILESASFRLPTVDIGIRQKGRMAPENVIHCECNIDDIVNSINICLSNHMKEKLENYISPYGDGHAAERMVQIIKDTDFSDIEMVCKKFVDRV